MSSDHNPTSNDTAQSFTTGQITTVDGKVAVLLERTYDMNKQNWHINITVKTEDGTNITTMTVIADDIDLINLDE